MYPPFPPGAIAGSPFIASPDLVSGTFLIAERAPLDPVTHRPPYRFFFHDFLRNSFFFFLKSPHPLTAESLRGPYLSFSFLNSLIVCLIGPPFKAPSRIVLIVPPIVLFFGSRASPVGDLHFFSLGHYSSATVASIFPKPSPFFVVTDLTLRIHSPLSVDSRIFGSPKTTAYFLARFRDRENKNSTPPDPLSKSFPLSDRRPLPGGEN